MKVANKSFENVVKFRYMGSRGTNQNYLPGCYVKT
jgi:hypothetical protein